MRSLAACSLLLVLSLASSCAPRGATALGTPSGPASYQGVVRTEWVNDGRRMKLLEDYVYVDAAGKRWKAKKGQLVDGASIPRALWWAGGPYEGTYRDASVIHDVYCDEFPKTATWRAVHRMFYEAMLTSGVEKTRALVMFAAVYRFGPQWDDACVSQTGQAPPGCAPPAPDSLTAPTPVPPPPDPEVQADMEQIRARVNSGQLATPEQIEAMGRAR